LTTVTGTFTPDASGNISLGKADIFKLKEVRDGSSTGRKIRYKYKFDNGQRDNFYGVGKLTLNPGQTAPAGDVYLEFDYFAHGASGDFFCAQSYAGQVDYSIIPGYRQSNGESFSLRDVLDFRSRKSDGDADFTSSGAVIIPLPRNNEPINYTEEFYLGVKGKTVISREGWWGNFIGDPSPTPVYPSIPGEGTGQVMEIAKWHWYPYMITDGDMSLTYLDNRRYTMRDIGVLDKRLGELEELTSLTLLELDAKSIDVLDSDGLDRFKSGITADPFNDHSQSDTSLSDYRASIDMIRGEVRPLINKTTIELVYDSDLSTNTLLKGDNVYPNFTSTLYKQQETASRSATVNPFEVARIVGNIKLSPSSDNWFDERKLPAKLIPGTETIIASDTEKDANYHNTNWSGTMAAEEGSTLKVGEVLSEEEVYGDIFTTSKTVGAKTTIETYQKKVKKTQKVVAEGVRRETLGTYVRDQHSIPYARAKFVSFKATGLKPNTQYFPFLNDFYLNDYINATAGTGGFNFVGGLARDSRYLDAGTQFYNTYEYPSDLGGKTTVVTDANGAVSGYFLIPNNLKMQFKTGKLEFKLNDVSVPDITTGLSYSTANFESTGILREVQDEILTTRVVQVANEVTPIEPDVLNRAVIDQTPPAPVYIDNTVTITNNNTTIIEKTIVNEINNTIIQPVVTVDPPPPPPPPVIMPSPPAPDPIVEYIPPVDPPVVTPVTQPVVDPPVVNPAPPYTPPDVGVVLVAGPPAPVEPSCFTGETLITMADGSKKQISDIEIDDVVLGGVCKGCGEQHGNKVIGFETPKLGFRKVYGFNGGKPFMSEEHPVKTTDGWAAINVEFLKEWEWNTYDEIVKEELKDIQSLSVGHTFVTESGNEKIENFQMVELPESTQLYNLILDGNNTYYAEGILVHNKCSGYSGGVGCGNAGGVSCFVAGTEITMADGSIKLIEDVQIGDELISGIKGNISKVFDFDHPMLGNRKLYGFNGDKPFVTAEHPFMTTDGLKAIDMKKTIEEKEEMATSMKGNLEVGDRIVKADGSHFVIESIDEHDVPNQQLYNFILEGESRTYVANGMIVHNKGGGGGGCVIATHAVSSGAFSQRQKAIAVVWCEKVLHDKWWGDIIRRGYRFLGRKKIANGEAHKYYQDFKDYVDFGRGKNRTLKKGIKFVSYTTRFFVAGLLFAKKDD
jgi:hypothetical protein